jgi:hypothetical protein
MFPKGTKKEEVLSREAVEKFPGFLLTDNKCLRIALRFVPAARHKAGYDQCGEELVSITWGEPLRIDYLKAG